MLGVFFKNIHTRENVSLAWPLVLTQVGHIITGMVDNIFLGRIGATEQAAGILSNNIYMLLLVFSIGLSYGSTPLVTAAHEAGDVNKKAALFKNSLALNFSVALICFTVLFFSSRFLYHMQQPLEVAKLAEPFFNVLIFSMLPISLFFSCKQYCEGLSNTRMALLISVVGNLLNIILNYVLIYGKFGFPELGYIGAAWASFYARLFMGLSFLFLIFRYPLTAEIAPFFKKIKIASAELFALWRIGWNSAMQFTFEVAAFVIAGLMAGKLGKENIDAHGIALSIASFTYMFGSGIASAATIRVGIYNSKNDVIELRKAAVAALKLVVWVSGTFGIIFLVFHKLLPLIFSTDPAIIELAATLLIIAAMFQLFDGLQVVLIGILRAMQDVRIPTYVTLIAYWLISLPLGWLLAFKFDLGTVGIWIALSTSLILVAISLAWRLHYLLNKK